MPERPGLAGPGLQGEDGLKPDQHLDVIPRGALERAAAPVPYPILLGGNFAARRETLLQVGGFDAGMVDALRQMATELRARVAERTEGLSCSVGIGSSKFMAKVASEMAKPSRGHADQVALVAPGTEAETIAPLPARAIPGVGPVTAERLETLGFRTIGDVRAARQADGEAS